MFQSIRYLNRSSSSNIPQLIVAYMLVNAGTYPPYISMCFHDFLGFKRLNPSPESGIVIGCIPISFHIEIGYKYWSYYQLVSHCDPQSITLDVHSSPIVI